MQSPLHGWTVVATSCATCPAKPVLPAKNGRVLTEGRCWEGGKLRCCWDRDGLPREEVIIAAAKHVGGKAPHQGFRLEMEVPEHLVATPPPQHANQVGVDFGTQKGHGSTSAERAGGDITRANPKAWMEYTGLTQQGRDVGG